MKPSEIVRRRIDNPLTTKQEKELIQDIEQKLPVETNKVIAMVSYEIDETKSLEKVREIECKNVTIIADNLSGSRIHARFFDAEKHHKAIYTRQLGSFVKWMYSKMDHSDVKEIWEAVGQIIEHEDRKNDEKSR
ncbi:hypothetical protein PV433_31110 [Paenibacillus sp. GYB004]|uniref:hypothetical protein n=1 Tax=Paenibacillus sp. GYB004 TaxID=2994393 RepID=UPI002F9692C3